MVRIYALATLLGGSPLAAAAPAGDGFGLGTITQVGVTGTLAACLAWFARTVYAREARRADEAYAELRELNAKIMTEHAPTLARATDALAAAAAALARVR